MTVMILIKATGTMMILEHMSYNYLTASTTRLKLLQIFE